MAVLIGPKPAAVSCWSARSSSPGPNPLYDGALCFEMSARVCAASMSIAGRIAWWRARTPRKKHSVTKWKSSGVVGASAATTAPAAAAAGCPGDSLDESASA